MGKRHSLHAFVHRILVYRLIGVGLSLSLLVGLAVLFVERNRVSQETIDMAMGRLAVFTRQYQELLEDPDMLDPMKIRQAMIEFNTTQSRIRLGSFVFVGIYDLYGTLMIEFFDEWNDNLGKVKSKPRALALRAPEKGRKAYEIIRIAGLPYLKMALPFVNNSQQTVGIINAVFEFSPVTIQFFRMRALRGCFVAAGIVMLTTAILYPVILRLTQRITRFSVRLLEANLDTLETLGSAIAQRDSDTNAHNYRVSIYAVRIGEALGLNDRAMRTLIKGAFLHDVGKIGVPDHILLKPGKLDEKEFEVMKTHVEQGCRIIERSGWLHDAMDVVASHHEKLTGKGYPNGTSGGGIPVTARIFAIADVFDALTSKRPYKGAFSFEETMKVLEESRGEHFDPFVLDTFKRIARPLYDRFGGKEEVFREELDGIIRRYFHEGVGSLEY